MDKPMKGNSKIPGTICCGQDSQLLISSGIHALDSILGGGLPVGTVAIIEEDMHGSYSKVMLDYFLAEGIVTGHSTFVASLDSNPHNIIKELPAVIQGDPEPVGSVKSMEDLKIAFRYRNLQYNQKPEETSIGHFFDLSKRMDLKDVENSDVQYWNGQMLNGSNQLFVNPAYHDLLRAVKAKICDGKFFLKDNSSKKSILRIGIQSLGSPRWLPPRKSFHLMNEGRDLEMFIFCLRTLVRSAYATAVISIPSHLYHENFLSRLIPLSDIAMRLQAFAGTELENNVNLSDYHGFFHLTKLAAINSTKSKHPGSIEYVFKLKRKKFHIEKLHLPPDIQEISEKHQTPSMGCASGNRHLEF